MGGCVLPFLSLTWRKVLLAALLMGAFVVLGVGRAEGETTLASWYGPGFEGLPTASGETYDPYGYTAAHKTLPLGTELVVSYGGSSVGVTVNDRGPYVGARELDLSQGAAEAIGLTAAGVDYVEYSYTGGATAGYDQYAQPAVAATDQYADEESAAYDQYVSAAYEQYLSDTGVAGDQYGGSGSVAPSELVYEAAPISTATEMAKGADGAGHEPAAGGQHRVRPGETLSGISARVGVSVEELAAANGVADPDVIYAGQTLYY